MKRVTLAGALLAVAAVAGACGSSDSPGGEYVCPGPEEVKLTELQAGFVAAGCDLTGLTVLVGEAGFAVPRPGEGLTVHLERTDGGVTLQIEHLPSGALTLRGEAPDDSDVAQALEEVGALHQTRTFD